MTDTLSNPRFCMACGKSLPVNARFCAFCGHAIGGAEAEAAPPPPSSDPAPQQSGLAAVPAPLLYGALAVSGLLLGAAIWYFLMSPSDFQPKDKDGHVIAETSEADETDKDAAEKDAPKAAESTAILSGTTEMFAATEANVRDKPDTKAAILRKSKAGEKLTGAWVPGSDGQSRWLGINGGGFIWDGNLAAQYTPLSFTPHLVMEDGPGCNVYTDAAHRQPIMNFMAGGPALWTVGANGRVIEFRGKDDDDPESGIFGQVGGKGRLIVGPLRETGGGCEGEEDCYIANYRVTVTLEQDGGRANLNAYAVCGD